MKTIKVQSKAKLSVKPDFIQLYLTLKSIDKDYQESINISTKQLQELKDVLVNAGFLEENIKTTAFNVAAEYEHHYGERGVDKKEFIGYSCKHQLVVGFDFDKDVLAKSIDVISKCIAEPQLSISFTVKNLDKVNDSLLKKLTLNAKKRAKVLAKASGVQLGDLVSIDYGDEERNFESRTRANCNLSVAKLSTRQSDFNLDINPEDIDVEEEAIFVWEIL